MVIVDLWIFTANEIYIMKKMLGPISVLDCFRVPCVRQFPSKRGGEPIIATRCWEFTIEEPQGNKHDLHKVWKYVFVREMLELEQTVRRIMATPQISGRSILSLQPTWLCLSGSLSVCHFLQNLTLSVWQSVVCHSLQNTAMCFLFFWLL